MYGKSTALTEPTAPAFSLLDDYSLRKAWPFALAFVAGALLLGLDRTWVLLALRFWLTYSIAYLAVCGLRAWLKPGGRSRFPSLRIGQVFWLSVAVVLVVSVVAAVGSLLLTPYSTGLRLSFGGGPTLFPPKLAVVALPLAFSLALHLPPLLWRARAEQRARSAALLAAEREHQAQLARQVALSELNALQAQIEPHFLYNTLANVQYLLRIDAARAEDMLQQLHQYLRAALPAMRAPMSTVGREADLAMSYLNIMKVRMGERLRTHFAVAEEAKAMALAPTLLATLVENALRHGIEPVPEGGTISVVISMDSSAGGERVLTISVADDGAGLGSATQTANAAGSGVGLSNLRERLELLHGAAGARLSVTANPAGKGVLASITIMLKYSGDEKQRPLSQAWERDGVRVELSPKPKNSLLRQTFNPLPTLSQAWERNMHLYL